MEEWFTHRAADGFNLLPPHFPGALNDFVDMVVPELRRRGLFRSAYEGRTLRVNLGLPRPASISRQPRIGLFLTRNAGRELSGTLAIICGLYAAYYVYRTARRWRLNRSTD